MNQQKNVHYFPGHMKRAIIELQGYLKAIDLVIEVADARDPYSSRNPSLISLLSSKPQMLFLTKTDLADPSITSLWVKHFENKGMKVVAADLKKTKAFPLVLKESEPLLKAKREKEKRLGMKPQSVRLLIVGVPNVGKSTLINNLAGKQAAKAANKPGVTKSEQWIKLPSSFLLLDSPGILPMNYPDGPIAIRLALTGSIKEEVLPIHELSMALLSYLKENYPNCLASRYEISSLEGKDEDEVLSIMASKRGYLKAGGIPDIDKAASLLLKDFQAGNLGAITLERP
jgi:ribosome biogenesis GTPase A